jgi:chromosome segregation protein
VQLTEAAGARRSIVERVENEWHRPFEQLIETAPVGRARPRDPAGGVVPDLAALEAIGPVNPLAVEEHAEEVKRLQFLTSQRDDLVSARQSLIQAIREIDGTARSMFLETFTASRPTSPGSSPPCSAAASASSAWPIPDDPLESEIDIHAAPRGKRTSGSTCYPRASGPWWRSPCSSASISRSPARSASWTR